MQVDKRLGLMQMGLAGDLSYGNFVTQASGNFAGYQRGDNALLAGFGVRAALVPDLPIHPYMETSLRGVLLGVDNAGRFPLLGTDADGDSELPHLAVTVTLGVTAPFSPLPIGALLTWDALTQHFSVGLDLSFLLKGPADDRAAPTVLATSLIHQ